MISEVKKRPDTRWRDEIEKFAGIACQRITQNRQLWKELGKAFVQQWTLKAAAADDDN